ncbi:hypothetical protein EPUL_003651, partial [Erysiphe pulchra]
MNGECPAFGYLAPINRSWQQTINDLVYTKSFPMPISLSSQWSATSRNIFNRLSFSTLIHSRSRNLSEFHIRPDEPHRKYSPGDTVKGTVVLTVSKPIRITHLTVCLHGYVRVFKSPNGANEPFVDPGLTATQNPQKSQYFGNGHASLFQDEVILCGEGRLDAGIYEFKFELLFPSKGLPTSIDFERGTISYLITATITRPTSINATSSCDRKISLVEKVDIGPILPPKPRIVCLTPIIRKKIRSRASFQRKEFEVKDEINHLPRLVSAATNLPHDNSASILGSFDHQIDRHLGKRNLDSIENQSIKSSTNSVTSSEESSREGSLRTNTHGTLKLNSHQNLSKQHIKDQTITAKIEVLRSGCLPGDFIYLKIYLKHKKAIRSMHGIIVTLYRHGRIDSAPFQNSTLQKNEKDASRLKHEEYYPKSKTGLSGLSLTSAGSSSIFRKDLAQTFAPIVIDPNTLTAVINTSIRMPEHVFPTIHDVPGEIVTFKYNVEVCLDLGGKLATQQRHVPLLGSFILPSTSNYMDKIKSLEHDSSLLSSWGGSIIGTEALRREKNVVTSTFEIIVGTEDSTRNWKSKIENNTQRLKSHPTEEIGYAPPVIGSGPLSEGSPILIDQEEINTQQSVEDYIYTSNEIAGQYLEYYSYDQELNIQSFQDSYLPTSHGSIYVPPPDIFIDDDLSDKERARRAEERLLPSCPPLDVANFNSIAMVPIVPSSLSGDNIPTAVSDIPRYLNNSSTSEILTGDDKQELELQRLMAATSAPPISCSAETTYDDFNSNSGCLSVQPTAPIFSDEDEYTDFLEPQKLSTSEILP